MVRWIRHDLGGLTFGNSVGLIFMPLFDAELLIFREDSVFVNSGRNFQLLIGGKGSYNVGSFRWEFLGRAQYF